MLKNLVTNGSAEEYPQRKARAVAECNAIIERNINLLSGLGKLGEFAKWSWFKNKMSEAIQSLMPPDFP